MTFRENLLKFLNEQKESSEKEINNRFKAEKAEYERVQQELRDKYLDGMKPDDFIKNFKDKKFISDVEKVKYQQAQYNRFINKGGHRHPFARFEDWKWYLSSEIEVQTKRINSLIEFVESEHFEDSYYSRFSILENYSNLQEAENKLNTIRAIFPDDDNNSY